MKKESSVMCLNLPNEPHNYVLINDYSLTAHTIAQWMPGQVSPKPPHAFCTKCGNVIKLEL